MNTKQETSIDWLERELDSLFMAHGRVSSKIIKIHVRKAREINEKEVKRAYDFGWSDGYSKGLFYDKPEHATSVYENSEDYYNKTYKS